MMKLLQILFTGGSCVAFFVTMYWSVRGFAALLSQFGAYKVRRYPIECPLLEAPSIWQLTVYLEPYLALDVVLS